MKFVIAVLVATAALGLGACSTTINNPAPTAHPSASVSPGSATPAPAVTKTIIKRPGAQPSAPAPAPAPTVPNVTDPWAVVSAYYGDIESGHYRQAWTLLSSGAVTGQSYQQFAAGFSCTGSQQLTELGETGDTVRFELAATNACTGAVQHFSGADTVQNGKIVAADVRQTG
jgi:hypothetical protein